MNEAMRKPLAGVIIGAGLTLAAGAGASTASGWFSGLFETGGTSTNAANQTLLQQADAAVQAQLDADQKNCDEVGIGKSIRTAIAAQTQMASATPQVESLFDPSANCFASVNQLVDLSFAIPSLSSILTSAANAVTQYAQKQVCTAVNQVSSLVTSPVNQVIAGWNALGTKFTDISGMGDSQIGGALSQIDPQLGAQYRTTVPGGTYTIGTNTFSQGQTTFNTATASTVTTATPTQPVAVTPTSATTTTNSSSEGWLSSISSLLN